MNDEDLRILTEWLVRNQDHKFNFVEKEAIKAILRKADTVGDLARLALKLLKKQSTP